jgi:anti-sigma-K factor RskA
VNDSLEHRECAVALGAYALGALPDAEAMRVRRHLDDCRECRGQWETLRAAVEALPAGVTLIAPPPELKARIMATVDAEAELLQAAGAAADRPPPARRPRRGWLTAPGRRPAFAIAAGCLVAVGAAVAILATTGPGTRTLQAQITDPALTGLARASLSIRGTRAELRVSGLPIPTADHVDELWVQRAGASPQPAGTFVVQSGSIDVQRPVHSGDLVLVTVEPGRGGSTPTTAPLMTVRV